MSFEGKGKLVIKTKRTERDAWGFRVGWGKKKTTECYKGKIEIRDNQIFYPDNKDFNHNHKIFKSLCLFSLYGDWSFKFDYSTIEMTDDGRFFQNKSVNYIELESSETAQKFKAAFLAAVANSYEKSTKPSSPENFDAKKSPEEPKKPIKTPEVYLCPITFQLMSDPVITPSGNSFEREAIEKSIAVSGVCPLTREPLKFDQLVPNRALKQIIDQWKLKNVDVQCLNNVVHNDFKKDNKKPQEYECVYQ